MIEAKVRSWQTALTDMLVSLPGTPQFSEVTNSGVASKIILPEVLR